MLAALSVQLCDMLCCVLKMGHKLKFHYGICFIWNDGLHLNKEIGQLCLILIGLLLWVLWKRPKEDIFFATKQSRSNKNSILKDIHSLGPYFTRFTLNEKFNACYIWLKCMLECTNGRNVERKFRILLFWKFVSESLLSCSALYM